MGSRSVRARCLGGRDRLHRGPLALALRYDGLGECDLARLHNNQIDWHRDWTESYDSWRLAEGMIPVDPRDHMWPVAPVALPAA